MKFYRTVAIILTIFFTFSMMVVSFAEENVMLSEKEVTRQNVLSSLDIMRESEGNLITRSEFAEFAAALINIDEISYNEEFPFTDVSDESSAYSSIGYLYKLSVLNGADLFYPDRVIAENEAIKILISLLGYNDEALYLGGYPGGYYVIASREGLTAYLNGDNSLSRAECINLLYKCLDVKIRYEIVGEGTVYDGKTVLEKYHGLMKMKGQITASSRTGLTDGNNRCMEGCIEIDGKLFVCDEAQKYNDLIGHNVQAYFSKDSENDNTLYALEVLPYKEKKIDASDIEFSLEGYLISDFENKYSLSKDYQVIYNGVAVASLDDNQKIFDDGEYILLDSNSDGLYDIVKINKTEYVVVDNFSSDGNVITDINKTTYGTSKKKILSFGENDVLYEYYIFSDGVFKSCSMRDLRGYKTLGVQISADEKFMKVFAFDKSVEAVISGVSENGIIIAGTDYPKSAYAKNVLWSCENFSSTVLLTESGKALCMYNEKGNMKYGYIMKIGKDSHFGNYQALILTESGNREIFTFADRITVDGITKPSKEMVDTDTVTEYSFIRYSSDENKNIMKIDKESTTHLYEKNLPADNSLRRYYKEEMGWYSDGKILEPYLAPVSAKVFCVPSQLGDSATASQYSYNEKDFYVSSISDFGKGQGIKINCAVYDVDENGDCGAILRFTNDNPDVTLATLGNDSMVGVVDKVVSALNSEGDTVKRVTIARADGFKKYYFSRLLEETFNKEKRVIEPGDIVRYEIIGDTLTNLRVEYSRKNGFDTSLNDYRFGTYENRAIVYYHIGKLYSIANSHAFITDKEDGKTRAIYYNNAYVLKYDKSTNSIKPINKLNAISESNAGENLGWDAVAITRYVEGTKLFVVYEK